LHYPYFYPQSLDPCLLFQLHRDRRRNPSLVLRPRVSFRSQSSEGSTLCTRLPLANEQSRQRGHCFCCCGHWCMRDGAESEDSMARPLANCTNQISLVQIDFTVLLHFRSNQTSTSLFVPLVASCIIPHEVRSARPSNHRLQSMD
jgi:hypothetical protein